MKKAVLFAFNGDPMCFVHVLLNAFDLNDRGYEVRIVIEGSATRLVRDFHEDPAMPFAPMYQKAKEGGLIGCVCKACATKTGSIEAALEQYLPLCDEMSGHPSIGRFVDDGYQVFTF